MPLLWLALIQLTATAQQAEVTINGNGANHNISRHIYGHFAEHLGRCIYDGFWVADTMKVAKKDRIRLDVVEASLSILRVAKRVNQYSYHSAFTT